MYKNDSLSIFQEDVEKRYNKLYGVSTLNHRDNFDRKYLFPTRDEAIRDYYNTLYNDKTKEYPLFLYSVDDQDDIEPIPILEGQINIFQMENEVKWTWVGKENNNRMTPDKLDLFYTILKNKLNEEDDVTQESVEDLKEELENIKTPEELSNMYMKEAGESRIDPFKAFVNDNSPQPKVTTNLLKDFIYPFVERTLSNPSNVRKFNQVVARYIDRNIEKLTTSGPVYLVPFTDRDKMDYYTLFEITEKQIKTVMTEHTKSLNGSKFLFLRQNPIYSLLFFTIRYFTLKRDSKSLNSAITIYALANYPTIYTKYFPKGVIEPVMKYTIDNLTDKFLIKKSKHVFGLLVESAQRSYEFLKKGVEQGNDSEVVRFIQRIHNDQNSMFKKLSNFYYENHKNGYAIGTTNQQYDDNTPIIDEVDNATTEVQNAVNKVSLPIISNGVDIVRAEAAAKMSQIGVSDCRLFLINIMTDKNILPLQKIIEAILFLYLYESKKTIRDVRSQFFLAWSASLFKKTNSKNKNIVTINTILNTWAEESGIYAKYQREASRTNYKKAIFFYVVLSIQKYIG